MRKLCLMATVLSVFVLARPIFAEEKPAGDPKLAALERFTGEWAVEGKWSNGEPLHARAIYKWSLGKKILKAKTFVMAGDKEYQRYEGVLAWHPEKKSLYEISFAYDGHISEVLIETKDKDTLHIGWAPFAKDQPSPIRQVIKFLGPDRFQWVVTMKEGNDWKQLIDATWKRKETK